MIITTLQAGRIPLKLLLRNYFWYLWGLPMKLMDTETSLAPKTSSEVYLGKEAYELRVAYEKTPGIFIFLRKTINCRGYRFYQNQEETKGEWIKLQNDGIRIPSEGSWFALPDMAYPETDTHVNTQ